MNNNTNVNDTSNPLKIRIYSQNNLSPQEIQNPTQNASTHRTITCPTAICNICDEKPPEPTLNPTGRSVPYNSYPTASPVIVESIKNIRRKFVQDPPVPWVSY